MPLLFTSLGGSGVRCTGGGAAITVFPADPSKVESGSIVILARPEEKRNDDVISWPGEYNRSGVSVHGVGHGEGQQVSYVVETDNVRIGFLSSPLQDWTDKQLEMVGDIDVLVLSADDAKIAQKLVDEFDPRILILLPGKDKAAYDAVAKAVGVKPESIVEEYKLKGSLPAEGREVVVLKK